MNLLLQTYLYDLCEREVDTRRTSTSYLWKEDDDGKEGVGRKRPFTEN